VALIQTKEAENIATIAFDNYAKRNALGATLIAETIAALEQFKAKGVRAEVLRSAASEQVWSAGHDMSELPKADNHGQKNGELTGFLTRAINPLWQCVSNPHCARACR
jgi:enoyl-CoA hydratase/carnithine racemase